MTETLSPDVYSETLIDHFQRPRNAGAMEDADAEAFVTNPVCGDSLRIFLKFEDGRIARASFLSSGCPASIATSSVATELVRGLTADEAVALGRDDYAAAVGGLPKAKVHCSVLAAAAVTQAVEAYRAQGARVNVAAIILAAGASSRMGRAKALLPWEGTTLLGHELEVLRATDITRVAVVTGMHAQQIRRQVPVPMPFVFNPRWPQGRSTSLAAGARQLLREPRPDAVLVQNVDQPTTAAVIRALVEVMATTGADAVQPVYVDEAGAEHGGHPVLVSSALLPAMAEAREATEGLRGVLRGRRVERVRLDDPTVSLDLDTPEAYAAARERLGA